MASTWVASSTFGAGHPYLPNAITHPDARLSAAGKDTLFEVVTGGNVHVLRGEALRRWIAKRRETLKGPKGMLFSQRPV